MFESLISFQWRDIEEIRIMDSKLKCSFEMPTVEQLLESKNYHDENTVGILLAKFESYKIN